MKASIAILNYNGEKLLPVFLPSVIEHTPSDIDIYVIDNASTDNSITVLKTFDDRIKLVILEKNYGFAGGYNEGLKKIDADIYFLFNSDIALTANWHTPLLDALASDKSIGGVVSKIRSYNEKSSFEYAGAAGGYLDRHGYAFCRGRIFDEVETDEGQYDEACNVAWGSGCALGIRAELFHGLGGFDETFFAHYEEIDLCWRLRRTGYKIRCVPSSVVYHLGGGTMDYASSRKLFLNFRNSLFTLYKNHTGWKKWSSVFMRLFLDGIAGFKFLLSGNLSGIAAIFKAHFSFYGHLTLLNKNSKTELAKINKLRIGPNRTDGHKSYSIIWRYFIKRQKTFKALDA